MTEDGTFDPPRDLTADERNLLDYMIGLVPSSQAELRVQAGTARVTGVCTCGCGTFDLVTDPATPPAEEALETPAADAVGAGDDHPLEVLLFVGEGRLGCVEIVRYGDVPSGKRLPAPDELEMALWSERDKSGTRRLLNEPILGRHSKK